MDPTPRIEWPLIDSRGPLALVEIRSKGSTLRCVLVNSKLRPQVPGISQFWNTEGLRQQGHELPKTERVLIVANKLIYNNISEFVLAVRIVDYDKRVFELEARFPFF